jgi:hypothetical protein
MTIHPYALMIIAGVGVMVVGVASVFFITDPKRLAWFMPPEQAARAIRRRRHVMKVMIPVAVLWGLWFVLRGIGIL